MTILTGSGVGIQFGERWLYQDVAFKLEKGRVLALIGDNGVGKTTLLRAILGQLELTAGELDWQIDVKNRMISYVPQYRPDMQAFPLKVTDFVSLSFDKGILPWLKPTEKERLQHVLADTHLTKDCKCADWYGIGWWTPTCVFSTGVGAKSKRAHSGRSHG